MVACAALASEELEEPESEQPVQDNAVAMTMDIAHAKEFRFIPIRFPSIVDRSCNSQFYPYELSSFWNSLFFSLSVFSHIFMKIL